MKILCLNCRGVGQPEVVREIRSLCELHRPTLVFFSETRLFCNNVDMLKRSLGFPNGLGVGSYGSGGGLAFLWSHEIEVKLGSYDKIHMDVVILDPISHQERWPFTGFYGESKKELRYRSWDCLKFLEGQRALPWLCAGDFNEILEAHEQIGGLVRPKRQMSGFQDAVSVCGFTDLGFIGLPYTWDNRQQGDRNIKVRLDSAFANASFLDLYNEIKVWHVQTAESDHCCLVVECNNRNQQARRRKKSFRYENMWGKDPSYMDVIRNTWDTTGSITLLDHVMSQLGQVLTTLQ